MDDAALGRHETVWSTVPLRPARKICGVPSLARMSIWMTRPPSGATWFDGAKSSVS